MAALVVMDGNVSGDCNADTIPGDYDLHIDWGAGGGILTAASETTPGCALELPHHTSTIIVEDSVLGSAVGFVVGADYISWDDPTDPQPGCDLFVDEVTVCWGWCTPTFPPGADGAYWVYPLTPAASGIIYTI